jgi:Phytanoyl-CoA dioxygenase (PhyH)
MALATGQLLNETGFAEIAGVLDYGECVELLSALDSSRSERAGSRNVLDFAACQRLATYLKNHAALDSLLPRGAVAVQCTLFDKSADRNWLVALHQDLSIPVQERVPNPECSGWCVKEGVLHVQPPVALLQTLTALRVHLDDCAADNGPLRIVPGSHRHGRLSIEAATALRHQHGERVCLARRGDVLAMRPLVLHASSKARAKAPRRVLHFLFGPKELPCGLKWHRAI